MRLRHYTAVALNLLLFVQSAVLSGQEKRPAATKTEVSWSELAGLVTGQKIGLALAGDKKIEGKVLAVEPEALLLNVTKTSDRKAYPKGRTSIPRAAVPELRLVKSGRAGRIVLTTLGIVGGMTVGSLVGWKAGGDGAAGAVLAGMALGGAGLGAAGYFAGRSADRKVTVITVIPEPAESNSSSVGGATATKQQVRLQADTDPGESAPIPNKSSKEALPTGQWAQEEPSDAPAVSKHGAVD